MRAFLVLVLLVAPASVSGGDMAHYRMELEKSREVFFRQSVESGLFEYALHIMEYGNREALELAPELRNYADGATAVALTWSVARAINKNPSIVLSLIPDHFTIEEICTVPFAEAPRDVEQIHLAQAIRNLMSFEPANTEQEEIRDACLEAFNALSEQ